MFLNHLEVYYTTIKVTTYECVNQSVWTNIVLAKAASTNLIKIFNILNVDLSRNYSAKVFYYLGFVHSVATFHSFIQLDFNVFIPVFMRKVLEQRDCG